MQKCKLRLGQGAYGTAEKICDCAADEDCAKCTSESNMCVVVKYSTTSLATEAKTIQRVSKEAKGTLFEDNFLKFVSYGFGRLTTVDIGPGAVDASIFFSKLGKNLTAHQMISYLVQVFAALDFMYKSTGFLHMDLKAANTVILKDRPTKTPYKDSSNREKIWESGFLVVIIDYGTSVFIGADRKPAQPASYFSSNSAWTSDCYKTSFDAFRLLYSLRTDSYIYNADVQHLLNDIFDKKFKWLPEDFTTNETVIDYTMLSDNLCTRAPNSTYISYLYDNSIFERGSPSTRSVRSRSRSARSRSRRSP